MKENVEERIIYLDFLRAISVVGVMFIHFAGKILGSPDVGEKGWALFLALNCLGRFAVPVYFMISGSLFLDTQKSISLRKLYFRNIGHLAAAFLFWSMVNAAADVIPDILRGEAINWKLIKDTIRTVVLGPTHLWFLYPLAALYMITPLLRKISEDRKLTEYFLVLWVIFTMVGSFTAPIQELELFRNFISKFDMKFVYGYSGYFLLGYYLKAYYKPSVKEKAAIYLTGIAAWLFTIASTWYLSEKVGYYTETYVGAGMLNCLLMAGAVFVAAKETIGNIDVHGKAAGFIRKLAGESFGIYLMHTLVFRIFRSLGGIELLGYSIWGEFIIIAIIYMVSWLISYSLKKMAIVGKWVV